MKCKSTRYKRVGKCNPNKCGAFCCRMGPVLEMSGLPPTDKDQNYFYELFGWKKSVIGKTVAFHSNQSCRHLTGNKCSIYKNRPENPCKAFPVNPFSTWYKIAKKIGCSYKFIKVKK